MATKRQAQPPPQQQQFQPEINFSSEDLFHEGISSTWRSKKIEQKEMIIQTDEIQMQEQPIQTWRTLISNEIATAEKGAQRNQETQTEEIKANAGEPPKEEDAAILEFLNRVTPSVLGQLRQNMKSQAFNNYQVNWEEEIKELSCEHTLSLPNYYKLENLVITSLSWNAKGIHLAASFGRFDKVDWSEEPGYVAIWNILDNSADIIPTEQAPETSSTTISFQQQQQFQQQVLQPFFIAEEESYVMCLEFHPSRHNFVVIGTYYGTIKIYKVSGDGEGVVASTRIDNFGHKEPITAVNWVKNRFDDTHFILSTSTDGKLLLWSMKNKLEMPISSFSFNTPSPTKELAPGYGFSTVSFIHMHAGSSLKSKLTPSLADSFLVGTETGALLKTQFPKTTTNVPNTNNMTQQQLMQQISRTLPIDFQFDATVGYIHRIDSSPFHKNLFLTASSDGLVKFYNIFQQKDVQSFQPTEQNQFIYDCQFSPFRPLVFACCSSNGHLYIYDLLSSMRHEQSNAEASSSSESSSFGKATYDIDVTKSNGKKGVNCVKFNPVFKEYLATGDTQATIKIFKLNDDLTIMNAQKEMPVLQQLIQKRE